MQYNLKRLLTHTKQIFINIFSFTREHTDTQPYWKYTHSIYKTFCTVNSVQGNNFNRKIEKRKKNNTFETGFLD